MFQHIDSHFSKAAHQRPCEISAAYTLWLAGSKAKHKWIWMHLCCLEIKDLVMKHLYGNRLLQTSPKGQCGDSTKTTVEGGGVY